MAKDTDKKPVIGWFGAVFFGLGIPVSLLMLRPNHMYLKLDSEGFDIVTGSRHGKTRWRDVERFGLGKLSGNKMIGIYYSPDYTAQKTARSVAQSMGGIEGAIPDHYAIPIEELHRKLEEYRQRYS